jgi:hypothetical protein
LDEGSATAEIWRGFSEAGLAVNPAPRLLLKV